MDTKLHGVFMLALSWHIVHCSLWVTAAAVAEFASCNTGHSRLWLANADNLPAQCKPGHDIVAAAVFECFKSSRVSVQDCKILVFPAEQASKSGLDCRVMHARGRLTGASTASLTAVLDEAKLASFAEQHPGSQLLKGRDAAKLQQQVLSALQLLFAKASVRPASRTAASSGNSTQTGTTALTKQPKLDADTEAGAPAGADRSAADTGAAGSNSSASMAGSNNNSNNSNSSSAHLTPQRHHPRPGTPRPGHRQHSSNTTSRRGGVARQQQHRTPRRKGSYSNSTSSNSIHKLDGTASGSNTTGANKAEASRAKAPSETNSTALDAAAAPTLGTGRRLQQQQQQQGQAAALSSKSSSSVRLSSPHLRNKLPAAPIKVILSLSNSFTKAPPDENHQNAVRTLLAATGNSSSSATAKGAAFFRQGSGLILQPRDVCQFQYLVTRNPSVLQNQSGVQPGQRAHQGIAGHQSSSSSSDTWLRYVGVLFVGVSAVLAVVICWMAAQLWARYQAYDALPTEAVGATAANGAAATQQQVQLGLINCDSRGQQPSLASSTQGSAPV